mmetsp:Transcript_119414/g.380849  ORF Transcript_119414/g.380849 Transcript_119414/m.380849 type:complete len:202 (+) Transcript_119414:844-1449(+)
MVQPFLLSPPLLVAMPLLVAPVLLAPLLPVALSPHPRGILRHGAVAVSSACALGRAGCRRRGLPIAQCPGVAIAALRRGRRRCAVPAVGGAAVVVATAVIGEVLRAFLRHRLHLSCAFLFAFLLPLALAFLALATLAGEGGLRRALEVAGAATATRALAAALWRPLALLALASALARCTLPPPPRLRALGAEAHGNGADLA